jgi:hypothetical protein
VLLVIFKPTAAITTTFVRKILISDRYESDHLP